MRSFLFLFASVAMLLGNSNACCVVCLGLLENPGHAHPLGTEGVACGDSCITEGKCDKTHGCACSAKSRCCKFCDPDGAAPSKACGNGCIASDEVCDQPHGCACAEDVGHEEGHVEF